MVFEGANRANDYIEAAEPSAGTDPAPGRSPRREAERERRSEPQPLAPVASLDLDAMSRDLSGSWMRHTVSEEELTDVRAREGMRGMLARLGLPVKPGAAEQARLTAARALEDAEATVRQATFLRCMTILVAQRKGGVGKTPLAILLGGMLAHIRGGGVVIPEVSDDPGMIALRSEGSPSRGLGELMRDVHSVSSAGHLAGYTAPQTSHAAVIGSPNPRPNLSGDDVRAMHQLLSSYYAIQVLDSGNVYSSGAFQAALEAADALVIPVTDAADSIQDALSLVHHLQASAHGRELVAGATVLRLRYVEATARTVERVDSVLAHMGVRRILDIPADPHIAEHGELSLASLQPATRAAFLEAAAATVTALQAAQNKEKSA